MMMLFSSEPRPLRDYQSQAIEAIRDKLRQGHRRVVLMLATGGGKTRLAAAVIEGCLAKGGRAAFAVDSIGLVDQTLEAFRRDGITDIGVMQAQHPATDPAARLQIISVQTLLRRAYPDVKLVIVDECHCRSVAIERWMQLRPDLIFIGLSATPWAKGMGKHWQSLVIGATIRELTDQGYLTPARVFGPSEPDLSEVKMVAGDYHEGQLSKAMSKPKLVADIVETWIKLGEGRPTLCFGVDRAHAKMLQERFLSAGIAAEYVDMDTSREERQIIKRRFHDNEIQVVCNIGTMTKGIDWDVRCIIMARPTKSEMLFVQIVGRGLRPADEKTDCIILDHSGTTSELGLPEDIYHDTLDDGRQAKGVKAERKEPLPWKCPQCTAMVPVKTPICPSCGFERKKQSKVETIHGELVQVSGKKKDKDPHGMVTLHGVEIPREAFFGQLKQYASDKGYKPGWAANQYRDRLGTWPNHYRDAPLEPVSYEVDSWIRSKLIRWAKSRDKEGTNVSVG